jgi:hypothetical protein
MGGGRKRACLLLLPGVPQWGKIFYEVALDLIFKKQKYIFDRCTNDLKYILHSSIKFIS